MQNINNIQLDKKDIIGNYLGNNWVNLFKESDFSRIFEKHFDKEQYDYPIWLEIKAIRLNKEIAKNTEECIDHLNEYYKNKDTNDKIQAMAIIKSLPYVNYEIIDSETGKKKSISSIALKISDEGILDLLIEKGVNPLFFDKNGNNFVHQYLRLGAFAKVDILIDNWLVLNKDNFNNEYLTYIGLAFLKSAPKQLICKLIAKFEGSVNNIINRDLYYAFKKCNNHLIDYLLECGLDINKEEQGRIPSIAFYAVVHSDIETLKKLDNLKVDLNVTNNANETLLHIAAFNNNLLITKFLIKKGTINPVSSNIKPSFKTEDSELKLILEEYEAIWEKPNYHKNQLIKRNTQAKISQIQ